MPRATLLRCPVCDSPSALEGDLDEHTKAELLGVAGTHLEEHALSESAHALRKHETAAAAEECIVGDFEEVPLRHWAATVEA